MGRRRSLLRHIQRARCRGALTRVFGSTVDNLLRRWSDA
jgi:hypothetical protein